MSSARVHLGGYSKSSSMSWREVAEDFRDLVMTANKLTLLRIVDCVAIVMDPMLVILVGMLRNSSFVA